MAYVVPEDESVVSVELLRDLLSQRLPDYMVPSAFVSLDTLPLTPSQKVDRNALPVPDNVRPGLEQQYEAPRTRLEADVAQIWSDVLGVDRVGVRDKFFDLGGHSLMATQILSRVRQQFNVELPLRQLFDTPTVANLSRLIERAVVLHESSVPITPIDRSEDLPLSFAQERLWFLDQLEPDSPFYNVPAAVHLLGALDVARVELCLNEILRRHEALRTHFEVVEGRAVQRIAKSVSLDLPVIDLSPLPDEQREVETRRLATEEAQRPFSLATGPLVRACLLQLGPTDHVFLLTMHHIVSDGWSLGVFAQELATLYDASGEVDSSGLNELPIQYVDYAVWQRQQMSGDRLRRQRAFWKQELDGIPQALDLPTDRPRPSVQTYAGSHLPIELSGELTEALKRLSQSRDATLFMTLLAGFQTLLGRYSRQEQICVGTPIAGRDRSEIEGLIGVFINTLVLRGDLSGSPTFEELLARVRETTLTAYEHQDLPFELLVEELQPKRDLSRSPLFQAMFVLQNAPIPQKHLRDLTFSPLEFETGTSKFDLFCQFEETESGLKGWMEYNTDLFDASTIDRMVGSFEQVLESVVSDPGRLIDTIDLLPSSERHNVLVDWNATDEPYPDRCIDQLIAEQARRTPSAVAVVSGDDQLTYLELDRRSNQLARRLRALGVGPDVLVGICVARHVEMVVGLLGILKAGGAYVPLDPSFPLVRLQFMLEDTAAPVLLSEQSLLDSFPSYGGEIICLDRDQAAIAGQSPDPLSPTATAE